MRIMKINDASLNQNTAQTNDNKNKYSTNMQQKSGNDVTFEGFRTERLKAVLRKSLLNWLDNVLAEKPVMIRAKKALNEQEQAIAAIVKRKKNPAGVNINEIINKEMQRGNLNNSIRDIIVEQQHGYKLLYDKKTGKLLGSIKTDAGGSYVYIIKGKKAKTFSYTSDGTLKDIYSSQHHTGTLLAVAEHRINSNKINTYHPLRAEIVENNTGVTITRWDKNHIKHQNVYKRDENGRLKLIEHIS